MAVVRMLQVERWFDPGIVIINCSLKDIADLAIPRTQRQTSCSAGTLFGVFAGPRTDTVEMGAHESASGQILTEGRGSWLVFKALSGTVWESRVERPCSQVERYGKSTRVS